MAKPPGPIRRLWLQWKMMQLPWRRKWLVGFDLEGNTYWEFKDALHALRNRRIVKYPSQTHHSDVNVPPHWMQWLRYTRFEPPSLTEQRADVMRQERMKYLAVEADARWAAKPSALDTPDKQQPVQMLESRDPNSGIRQMNVNEEAQDRAEQPRIVEDAEVPFEDKKEVEASKETATSTQGKLKTPKATLPKQATNLNPGDEWQPQSWSPGPARRRG